MREYEKIVEDIRNLLESESSVSEDRIIGLEVRFIDAINEVNARLRQCESLLQRGLRSEAIQQCEVSPNLLDAVSVLDFSECDLWTEFVVQNCKHAAPPSLNSEFAAELNEAYTEEASLSDLLRLNRLNALKRSSLSDRLTILRRIALRDASNPIWQEDIKTFEKVRHSQIQKEVQVAVSQNDVSVLSSLEQEVRSDRWIYPPSDPIINRVVKAHTSLRVKVARRELRNLIEELTQAYASFDVDAGRRLRSRWLAQAAIGISGTNDELEELASPALQWLSEQDRIDTEESNFKSSIEELTVALDDSAARPELERLAFKLESFDRDFPPILHNRLLERYQTLEVSARRRGRLIAGASGVLILAAAGVLVWTAIAAKNATDLAAYESNTKKLVTSNNIDQARQYVKSAPEWVRNSAGIKKIVEFDIPKIEEQERQRKARFRQHLANVIQYMPSWDGYTKAVEELERATELSVNDIERTEISSARQKLESARIARQKNVDSQFLSELDAFRTKCEQIDQTDSTVVEHLENEGNSLANTPHVAYELKQQLALLLERLAAQKRAARKSKSKSTALAAISRSVGNLPNYRRKLNSYVAAMPQSPKSITFKRLIEDEYKFWSGIEQWNTIIDNCSRIDYRKLAPSRAIEEIERLERVLTEYPGFPNPDRVQELVTSLRSVGSRVTEGQPIQSALLQAFQDRQISDVNTAFVRDGNELLRYYLPTSRPPRTFLDKITLKYYTGFDLNATKSSTMNNDVLDNSDGRFESPQQLFSDYATDKLSSVDDTNWESSFYSVILKLHDDERIEPILKLQIMRRVLEIACAGSRPMQQVFGDSIDILNASNVDETANWIDPHDDNGRKASRAARKILQRMDSPDSRVDELKAKLRELIRPHLGPRHKWVGWLHRDESKWTCEIPDKHSKFRGKLYAVHASDEPGVPEFTIIGTKNRDAVLINDDSSVLVEGRPVYLREQN
ncbi:hypothetical protein ACFL2H_03770 [Planctomycetota bacterium]